MKIFTKSDGDTLNANHHALSGNVGRLHSIHFHQCPIHPDVSSKALRDLVRELSEDFSDNLPVNVGETTVNAGMAKSEPGMIQPQ